MNLNFSNAVAHAKQIFALGKSLAPEVKALVNEVRLLAHDAGQLGADHEADFQKLALAHTALMSPLSALPPVKNDAGLRTDGPTLAEWTAAGHPADKYPPEGYAVVTTSAVTAVIPSNQAEQAEYDAGVSLARARVPLPPGATAMAVAGYNSYVPPTEQELAAAEAARKKAEYDAGFAIGSKRGQLPDGASDDAKAGFLNGMSTGTTDASQQPTADRPKPTVNATSPSGIGDSSVNLQQSNELPA